MKNPQIELNVTIYDSLNDRYITPFDVGCDPNCYLCKVEERPEFPDEYVEMRNIDYEFVGRQLFTRGELQRMAKRG